MEMLEDRATKRVSDVAERAVKRVALVEPGRFPYGSQVPDIYSGRHQKSGVLMPRFGPQMAAWLKSLSYEVDVFSGEIMPFDIDELAEYDVVCVSALTNTAPHCLVLAKQLMDRGVTVVMGGYHFAHIETEPAEVLAQTEEALRFCDYVVRGEGYRALQALLKALAGDGDLNAVGGLSWIGRDGSIVHNPMGKGLTREEYAEMPVADWSVVRHVERLSSLGPQGFRGCPRKCKFCVPTKRDGKGTHRLTPAGVVDEIEAGLRAGKFFHIFFTTDNFPVFPEWADGVCQEMIDRGVKMDWSCQGEARIIVAHPELVAKMAKARCVRICMGIESPEEDALAGVGKEKQSRALIEEAIRICHDNGIAIHGMFIVGLPGDTVETIEKTRRWAQRMGIETLQFLCLAALPGSEDYEAHELWNKTFQPFEGALRPLNWLFVNGHYAQLSSATMSLIEIQDASINAMNRFYSWPRVIAPLVTPNLRAFFAGLRQGRGLWGSLLRSVWHQVVATALRYRGRTSMDDWMRHPLNRLWIELLHTAPGSERFNQICNQILALLPEGWVETFRATA